MIRQSVLLEQDYQKLKLAMDQQKQKTNSNKVKSPVKTKSKFTNRNSTKNDKIKKFMCDTFGEDGKEQKMMTKKERKKCVITSRNKRQRIF